MIYIIVEYEMNPYDGYEIIMGYVDTLEQAEKEVSRLKKENKSVMCDSGYGFDFTFREVEKYKGECE